MPSPQLVIGMGAVMPILDGFFVGLRLYTKQRKTRYGIDDYLIILALIVTTGLGALLIACTVDAGYGQHSIGNAADSAFTKNQELLTKTKKCSDIFNILQVWTLGPTKLSVLFFYRRIFRGKVFNIASWVVIALVLVWSITVFFTILFQCHAHINLLWSSTQIIKQRCLPGSQVALYNAGLDVATDIMILSLPVYWVSKLHMELFRRVLVCGVFLFGSLALIASVGRLVVFCLIYPKHNTNPDQIAYATNIAYFNMLEIGIAIVAACLPTLSPLVSDRHKELLSGAMKKLFTPSSRRTQPSKTYNKISETNVFPRDQNDRSLGVESFAMGGIQRETTGLERSIKVTTDTSQHSKLQV